MPAAVALGLASGEALIGIWVATQAVSLVRPFVRRPRSAVPSRSRRDRDVDGLPRTARG